MEGQNYPIKHLGEFSFEGISPDNHPIYPWMKEGPKTREEVLDQKIYLLSTKIIRVLFLTFPNGWQNHKIGLNIHLCNNQYDVIAPFDKSYIDQTIKTNIDSFAASDSRYILQEYIMEKNEICAFAYGDKILHADKGEVTFIKWQYDLKNKTLVYILELDDELFLSCYSLISSAPTFVYHIEFMGDFSAILPNRSFQEQDVADKRWSKIDKKAGEIRVYSMYSTYKNTVNYNFSFVYQPRNFYVVLKRDRYGCVVGKKSICQNYIDFTKAICEKLKGSYTMLEKCKDLPVCKNEE